MASITANELKIKGVSIVELALRHEEEAIITVRGQDKYVIMNLSKYNMLREQELKIALMEARVDIAEGRYVSESVEDHMKRVGDEL